MTGQGRSRRRVDALASEAGVVCSACGGCGVRRPISMESRIEELGKKLEAHMDRLRADAQRKSLLARSASDQGHIAGGQSVVALAIAVLEDPEATNHAALALAAGRYLASMSERTVEPPVQPER